MEKLVFDDSPSMRTIDKNGFMHVKRSHISKATVNPYLGKEIPGWEELGLDPERIYYGFRDPEELKKAASTFNGLPILLNHHPESADAPQKEFRVGSTGTDTEFKNGYLDSSLSITDKTAIDAINSGDMKEISCSYFFTPDFTPGEFEGAPYDFRMKDIAGNHVALVSEGRAGHDVAVADSKILDGNEKGGKMKKTAKDANPAIERAEVNNANFSKCIQAVEAQREGITPADIGLPEIAPETSIEEIVDIFMPDLDEQNRQHKIDYLRYMADYGKAHDAEPMPTDKSTSDADAPSGAPAPAPATATETQDAEPGHEDWMDERMKDPVFKEAFEMGVRYGESREKADPKRIDREHEREGEERYLKSVGDSVERIKRAAKLEAKKEMLEHFRKLSKAVNDCKSYIGNRDPMIFDSADEVYGAALKEAGFNLTNIPKSAYRYMFLAMNKERGINLAPTVGDSALSDKLPKDIDELLG